MMVGSRSSVIFAEPAVRVNKPGATRKAATMLDGWARRLIDPALDGLGRGLARAGISANAVTLAACAIGVAASAAIAAQQFWLGLLLILISRLGDGLDGAVAKVRGRTDLGGYLDIVLDFLFYGAIPLGFVLADPPANAVAGAVLIFTFYVNGASFLAFAVMAEKRGIAGEARGPKSLFFTTGLAEASETLAVFAAMCLFPAWFPLLALGFAAVTGYTALSRIVLAWRMFR
jgi:phosphatidylglycerophosphate synthase